MIFLLAVPAALALSNTLVKILPPGPFRELLWVLPFVLLGLAGLLGARMNQPLVFFASGLLAGAYALTWHLRFPLSAPDGKGIQVLSLALPLSALGLSVVRPGKIFSRRGALYLSLTLGPWAGLLALMQFGGSEAVSAVFWRSARLGGLMPLPWAGPALIALLMGLALFQRDRYLPEFQLGMALALVSLELMYGRALWPGQGPAWLQAYAAQYTAIGLVLMYAVYRLYWRKIYIDELTGLPNRRALDERLRGLDGRYFVAMSDIDHFKKFNDSFGHEEGDNVLRFVAAHLAEKTGGRTYRYGGEEFCIIAEDLDEDGFRALLETTRSTLAARSFSIRVSREVRDHTTKKDRGKPAAGDPVLVRITMSFGAQRSSRGGTAHEVIQLADKLLYKAKQAGRNCVVTGYAVSLPEGRVGG
jgi:diguanylate cyclase (GGDEF)-like protein